MEKRIIEDTDDIVDIIYSKYEENTEQLIEVVGCYDTIIDILNILVKTTDLELECVELTPPEYDGYDDAYGIDISDTTICVGKMYNEEFGCYFRTEADYSYVESGYESKYFETNDGDGEIFVFEYDIDNPDTNLCVDKDKKGFCFCYSDGDSGFHKEFVYKGEAPLGDKEIFAIISKYFSN